MSQPPTPPAAARLHPSRGRVQPGAPGFLWALVGVLAAIELVLSAADAGFVGSPNWRALAFVHGAFWQPLFTGQVTPVYPGQTAVMFLSHAFLHGGLLHLAMNSVILLALGKMIAAKAGAARTLLLFALSAIAGGLAFGLIATTPAPMIGASGAAFGFFGLWNAWEAALLRHRRMPLRPVLGTMAGLVLANVALYVFLSGGLAWEAHLGGYIMGWIAGVTFARLRLPPA